MKNIRETDSYLLCQDEQGNTRIYDKVNNCHTPWKVGIDVRDQLNHVKHLSDTEFDEYCKDEVNKF